MRKIRFPVRYALTFMASSAAVAIGQAEALPLKNLRSAVEVTGAYNAPTNGDWRRGMPATTYCGNKPESWVRGDAKLDPATGQLSLTVQLETDSTMAGPSGRVDAELRDERGRLLLTARSALVGRGGKPPGKYAVSQYTASVQLDPLVARQVASINLNARCTGAVALPFNVDIDRILSAIKIGVTVVAAL